MEEFVEDYTRYVKKVPTDCKKKADNNKKVTFVDVQKKKELEDRALKIVTFLIDGKLCPTVFIRCLKHIDQAYYQDVVEERYLSKLCGYALCGNKLFDIPKSLFSIDLKNKKVYDITERKKYCSSHCYTASLHIKQQIDNSPLWLRNFQESPNFTLKTSEASIIHGEEAGLNTIKPSDDENFVSVSSFTEISLTEMDDDKSKNFKTLNKNKKNVETLQTVLEDENEESNLSDKESTNLDSSKKDTNETKSLIIDNQVNIKSGTKKEKGKKVRRKRETSHEVLNTIKKSVYEWITIETLIFLYGEVKIKEMLNKELQEQIKKTKVGESNVIFNEKYLEICRKLQLNDIIDEKYDNAVLGNDKLKPLPNYKQLKEESKDLKLKVRSFYGGDFCEKSNSAANSSEVEPTDSEESSLKMPLLETTSIKTIRYKIYLNSICQSMTTLTQNLGISSDTIMDYLQILVKTFKLDAHNVMFEPAAWTIISIILLQLLTLKDSNLEEQLNCTKSKTYMALVFKYVPDAESFISNLLIEIANVNLFVERYLDVSDK